MTLSEMTVTVVAIQQSTVPTGMNTISRQRMESERREMNLVPFNPPTQNGLRDSLPADLWPEHDKGKFSTRRAYS